MSDELEVLRDAVARLEGAGIAYMLTGSKVVKLDFIVRKDTPFGRHEFSRRRRVQLPGFEAWIVSREDLVLSKLACARDSGSEPVREWLKSLPHDEKREVGADIMTVQFGWPLGMPLVRHADRDIWEVRSNLPTRIARTLFTLEGGEMVLFHGFIKKDRATPKPDLDLARRRLRQLRST